MDTLAISNLEFRWPGAERATLRIADLTVSAREHTFLSGPSGSGKSTLLNLISGVIQPQSGAVRVAGNNLEQLSAARRDQIRADHVGYIFQQFNLIPYLDAAENVLLPCRFSATRRQRAIEQSGSEQGEARRLLEVLFAGEIPDTGRSVSRLSVGQQQRVAAARALIGRPALIIADEPTSSLDQDARERFMSLLMEETETSGSTLLFVSHDRTLRQFFESEIALETINRAGSG